MIQPGNYVARATAIRFVKPKDTLGIQVNFELKPAPGAAPQRIFWTGWISEKAQPQTLKTLDEVLEWNGDDRVVQVPDEDPSKGMLANQDSINRKKEVELVIELETYEGKERARVKWVNNVGGGQFAGVSPEVVKNDLAASGFKAAFLARRQGAGVAKATPAPAPIMQQAFGTDDIPF